MSCWQGNFSVLNQPHKSHQVAFFKTINAKKSQEQAPIGHHSRSLRTLLTKAFNRSLLDTSHWDVSWHLMRYLQQDQHTHLASLERFPLILNIHWVTSRVFFSTMNTTKQTHPPACGQQELYTSKLIWAEVQFGWTDRRCVLQNHWSFEQLSHIQWQLFWMCHHQMLPPPGKEDGLALGHCGVRF